MSVQTEIDIVGMHCKSCEQLISDELKAVDGVVRVRVSLKQQKAVITSAAALDDEDIVAAVERAGYAVGADQRPLVSRNPRDWRVAFYGLIIAAALLFVFSQLGLDPSSFLSDNEADVSLVALVMGLTAGFSTCMALVGGLVVGVSARYDRAHPEHTRWQNFRPHLAFNLGRVAGFTALGGLIGLVGSALTFSPLILGLLTILAGLFMLLVGLQLTGLFPRLTSLTLPPKLAERLGLDKQRTADYHPGRTALLGGLTFFLPCGFTQAMQLFAVTTGSWQTGALVMGLFAVGTTPGLLLVGGLTSLIRGQRAKLILKIVGVLVAALALLSINSGLSLTGFRWSSLGTGQSSSSAPAALAGNRLELAFLGDSSFDQSELRIKKGQKYVLNITPKRNGAGCMQAIMAPTLSSAPPQLLQKGRSVRIELEAKTVGEHYLVCAMGVPFAMKIIVEE